MNLFFSETLYAEVKLSFHFHLEYFVIIVEQGQLTGILDKNLFSQNIRIPTWVQITLESTYHVQDHWQRKEDEENKYYHISIPSYKL